MQVVYDQWTQFQDFSGFMKKVENVDQQDEQKLTFKPQVLWSHPRVGIDHRRAGARRADHLALEG